jgi:flagellin FlaB
MMKRNIDKNELGSIGIGAMIVFIALILVAAVASAVIIQTGEKLQQNAQQTGQDTERELGGKITVNGVLIQSATTVRLSFESAPGSGVLAAENIAWSVSCSNDAQGGYNFVAGVFGDNDNTDLAVTGDTFLATDPDPNNGAPPAAINQNAVDILNPGVSYVIDMVLDPGPDTAGADCGFDDLTVNDQMTMWIHVEGGGSTFETLLITSTTPGTALI